MPSSPGLHDSLTASSDATSLPLRNSSRENALPPHTPTQDIYSRSSGYFAPYFSHSITFLPIHICNKMNTPPRHEIALYLHSLALSSLPVSHLCQAPSAISYTVS